MTILDICSPYLADVAALPWEIQKVIFQQYYSHIVLLIYVFSKEDVFWNTV